MAGYLTPVGKAVALNNLATNDFLYLGLATTLGLTDPPQLTSIAEVNVAGYARQSVTWTTATEAAAYLNNSNAPQFSPTADMSPAAYAFLTDAASGISLDAPVASLGAASAGGTFAAGTYYWVVTATNSKGETIASNEVSATLTLNQEQVLNWTAPTVNPAGTAYDTAGYKIYRGTVAGGENVLVTTITNPATLTYTDTGTAGTAGTPPVVSSASVGNIFYVWELAEPVSALANKPVYVPLNGLIIE